MQKYHQRSKFMQKKIIFYLNSRTEPKEFIEPTPKKNLNLKWKHFCWYFFVICRDLFYFAIFTRHTMGFCEQQRAIEKVDEFINFFLIWLVRFVRVVEDKNQNSPHNIFFTWNPNFKKFPQSLKITFLFFFDLFNFTF